MTRLHFAGSENASRFPFRSELEGLGFSTQSCPLDSFVYAAWKATNRLWVIDFHFWPHGLDGIALVLNQAKVTDVRILSKQYKERALYEAVLRNAVTTSWNQGRTENQKVEPPVQLVWRDWLRRPKQERIYPFSHDRFVIIDDGLWHFGYSAGGSSNHLCAASGPWSAEETQAIRFYEDLWRGLERG